MTKTEKTQAAKEAITESLEGLKRVSDQHSEGDVSIHFMVTAVIRTKQESHTEEDHLMQISASPRALEHIYSAIPDHIASSKKDPKKVVSELLDLADYLDQAQEKLRSLLQEQIPRL
jgi:hypothetical protein